MTDTTEVSGYGYAELDDSHGYLLPSLWTELARPGADKCLFDLHLHRPIGRDAP